MKTLKNTVLITLICLTTLSCVKEELETPPQRVSMSNEKVDAKADPNAPFTRFRFHLSKSKKIADYEFLSPNATVRFREQLWNVTMTPYDPKRPREVQVWSSSSGYSWTLRRTNPLPYFENHTTIVFEDQIWFIGGNSRAEGSFEVWNSTDGIEWEHVTDHTPFNNIAGSNAVVFNNRMFVFESWNGPMATGNQRVYSSDDGNDWVLENTNAFSYLSSGQSAVFKGHLYFVGGMTLFGGISNEIWKSSDGRNWIDISGDLREFVGGRPFFSKRANHAVGTYYGRVWVAGGSDDLDRNNNIWYSTDMENWVKFAGGPDYPQMYNNTFIEFKGRLFLLGGYELSPTTGDSKLKDIRTIRTIFY